MWLLQTAGLMRQFWNSDPLLQELGGCDLCLGFWVYLGLGLAWALPLWAVDAPVILFGFLPSLVEVVILAMLAALMAHLIRLGWLSKFGCEEI